MHSLHPGDSVCLDDGWFRVHHYHHPHVWYSGKSVRDGLCLVNAIRAIAPADDRRDSTRAEIIPDWVQDTRANSCILRTQHAWKASPLHGLVPLPEDEWLHYFDGCRLEIRITKMNFHVEARLHRLESEYLLLEMFALPVSSEWGCFRGVAPCTLAGVETSVEFQYVPQTRDFRLWFTHLGSGVKVVLVGQSGPPAPPTLAPVLDIQIAPPQDALLRRRPHSAPPSPRKRVPLKTRSAPSSPRLGSTSSVSCPRARAD